MGQRLFSYDFEKGYYSQRWPEEAKPYLHLEPYFRCWLDPDKVFARKRVLDIGAGECTYTRLVAERFGPKEVAACELFRERMLPAARANQNSSLSFVAGDCFQLPFKSATFDIVFGSFVLHQLPDLRDIVYEVRRVLSKRGCYIGIEPSPYSPVHLYRYVRGHHSPNQYLLRRKHLFTFRKVGFDVTIRYFCARVPRIRNRFLGTCMGIVAEKLRG